MPAPLKILAPGLLKAFYPVSIDHNPPQSPVELARFMKRWSLLPHGVDVADAATAMAAADMPVEAAPQDAPSAPLSEAIRLPAQWEPLETIMLTFPVMYPPLWHTHAQMIEAITPVAEVICLVPAPEWARAARYYLQTRGTAQMEHVHFLHLPTDDIWVRDYGPFVGRTEMGTRAIVDATFAPLAAYPQAQDNAVTSRWAAYTGMTAQHFDFYTEGGNYWSDGQGTLLVSDEMMARYPRLSRVEIEMRLREAFQFDKLIVLPRLLGEETGHIDLVCKLVDAQTVLINRPNGTHNDDRLLDAAQRLRRETNAQGQLYQVIELPFPPRYFNWGVFAIWRSYTNSLTVNGRVLVPVFGIADDVQALNIYREVMPDFEIVPIDCRIAANGGGAVHCLTKEIPVA